MSTSIPVFSKDSVGHFQGPCVDTKWTILEMSLFFFLNTHYMNDPNLENFQVSILNRLKIA